MKHFRSWAILGIASLTSCADPHPSLDPYSKGSPEFKNLVAQGAGSQRPAPMVEGQSLGLTLGLGPIFSYHIDPVTGNWSWISYDTSRQELISPETDLVAWGKTFIERYERELGIKPEELAQFENTLYHPFENQTMLSFQRKYQDLSVKGAFIQLIFARSSEGWRLREVINNSLGPINLGTSSSASAMVDADQARTVTGLEGLETIAQRPLIQPYLRNGFYDFRVATEFKFRDPEDEEVFTVTLDNDSSQILEAASSHIRARNEISAEHYTKTYIAKDQKFSPLPYVRVQDAANANTNADTGADGVIDVAFTNGTLVFGGAKSKAKIISEQVRAAETAIYSAPVSLSASGKTQVTMAAVDPAAINSYMGIHEVIDFVQKYIDISQLPTVVNGLQTRINKNDFCNAYYDPNTLTLNFFRQGTLQGMTCTNTSLIKDVVYHEWGHSLDDFVGVVNRKSNPQATGITDGAFSEGIGDILGSMIIADPNIGKGFFLNQTQGIRSVENTRKHPPANQAEAEVHSAGQIIGGAFWDLRKGLIAKFGAKAGADLYAKMFLQHLLVTDRYTDSYQSVLRIDDNDNNPATRSPNYCLINRAFAVHGLTGGTVEGDSCVDADPSLKVRVDVDFGQGQLGLIASSGGAASILFCPGKVSSCKKGDAGVVAFQPLKETTTYYLSSDRKFYNAEQQAKVQVKAGEVYTLISYDEAGKLIGSRALSFGSRDKSKDLSAGFK